MKLRSVILLSLVMALVLVSVAPVVADSPVTHGKCPACQMEPGVPPEVRQAIEESVVFAQTSEQGSLTFHRGATLSGQRVIAVYKRGLDTMVVFSYDLLTGKVDKALSLRPQGKGLPLVTDEISRKDLPVQGGTLQSSGASVKFTDVICISVCACTLYYYYRWDWRSAWSWCSIVCAFIPG